MTWHKTQGGWNSHPYQIRWLNGGRVREAIGAYRGMLNDAFSVDLENGVKWLSQRAAESFGRDYPELCRALEADSEDDIVREVMGK
jgi:hypothetical protein